MSNKRKYPRFLALTVAKFICGRLQPKTARLVVAGSLRRQKKEVSDVEILYIPLMQAGAKEDFFTTAPLCNVTDEIIDRWKTANIIGLRPNVNGHTTWGVQNKLAVHCASGIPVDFFSTTEGNWWVSLVIRTGGKETNLMLTTTAQSMGRKLHAYGRGIEILSTGEMLLPQSERDVFEMCGCKYLEPRERL